MYGYVVATAALLAIASTSGEKSLVVSLYYESLCPDCTRYIQRELAPSWNRFQKNIILDLVPYGNAHQKYVDGHWQFECQHGPRECEANKLHACVIDQACGGSGSVGCDVTALGHVVGYLDCVTRHRDQLTATKECAEREGLNAQRVIDCADSAAGDGLLNLYGNRTSAFRPKIGYVPTVAIDGKHSKAAEQDLSAEICRQRPVLCDSDQPAAVAV